MQSKDSRGSSPQKYNRESWAKDVHAVTGTIGSGKSTVIKKLAELGAFVISADDLSHEVVQPGSNGLKEVITHFGAQYLKPTGELNREALGKLVFDDPKKRAELEAILHPRIATLAKDRFSEAIKQGKSKLVYEVPLLFESGLDQIGFKQIIVITAADEVCVERVKARNKLSDEAARKRLQAQMPTKEKTSKADIVIDNSGTIVELDAAIRKLYAAL